MSTGAMHLFTLLLRVHGQMLRHWLRTTWQKSALLLVVLAGLMAGYLGLGYWLFHTGLHYLYHFPLVGPLLAQRVLFLIFLFFFVMLGFSNLIIGYTTLFQNRETAWFLSLPLAPRAIYCWKFFEALVVSRWALIFLSAPLMLAYGAVRQVSWPFYLQVAALYGPFVILPALLGSWAVLGLARIFSSRRLKWALLGGGTVLLASLFFGLRPVQAAEAATASEVLSFDQLLRHTRISVHPLLPSAWVARSILAWSEGLTRQGFFYFCMVLSNALMGLLLGFEVAGRMFQGSWAAAMAARSARTRARVEARRLSAHRLSLAERALGPLRRFSPPAAALVLKDVRLFWRDPSQWSQFLIFFALLCIYVANLRHVGANFQTPFWEVLISYLNLTACALTLSTLTTRFVFPQFSLEGRRIWILGLSPFGLPRVLWQKFWLAAGTTLTITTAMMLASSLVLHLGAAKVAFFAAAVALMSGALSGLAVGLGSIFPDFREDNPSKIVSGFGGTLCLVLSFVYVILFIALAALPELWPTLHQGSTSPLLQATRPAAAVLSLLTMGLPLWIARRRVKNLEI